MNNILLRSVLVGALGTAVVATLALSHRNKSADSGPQPALNRLILTRQHQLRIESFPRSTAS